MNLSFGYFVIKALAYSAWIFVGLRTFSRGGTRRAWIALGLGALRLCMGLGFGVVIWFASSIVFPAVEHLSSDPSELLPNIATYAAVYVPVRWIEWGIFDLALNRDARSFRGFLAGSRARSRWWRAGGIAISCLADIPVIVSMGGVLPVGRFMC